MNEKQEQEKEYLSKMKHTAGDFNRWITRFEDQMETCETIGVELSEEAEVLYFKSNLNDGIFGDAKHPSPISSNLRRNQAAYDCGV